MKEYAIKDMKRFCKKMRRYAIAFLSQDTVKKNIRDFITLKQCKQIIENLCDRGGDGYFIVGEDAYVEIIEMISKQIYQSALSKLAADDIIECAWDNEKNKMIFWMIEEDHTKRYIDLEPS